MRAVWRGCAALADSASHGDNEHFADAGQSADAGNAADGGAAGYYRRDDGGEPLRRRRDRADCVRPGGAGHRRGNWADCHVRQPSCAGQADPSADAADEHPQTSAEDGE